MKPHADYRRLVLLVMLIFEFCCLAQSEQTLLYQVGLSRAPSQAGDEIDISVDEVSNETVTTKAEEWKSSTNSTTFTQLRARVQITSWDANSGCGTAVVKIERFISGDTRSTNELLRSGCKVVGTYVAGEAFYKSSDASISPGAHGYLTRLLGRPSDTKSCTNSSGFVFTGGPRKIDECWETSLRAAIGKEIESFPNPLLSLWESNGVAVTQCFLAVTNLFSISCFHLQTRVDLSVESILPALRQLSPNPRAELIGGRIIAKQDALFPFDVSLPRLSFTRSTDTYLLARERRDGTNVVREMRGSELTSVIARPVGKTGQ